MKVSRKFLNDYIDVSEIDNHTLAEDMTNIGNEYDYEGKLINATKLIIGEVVECSNHPNSDHLHICKVNIGNDILDIVCGAPNVRKGIKVIVSQVGAILPDGEIKESMIRGCVSKGMLCSLKELGVDHKFLTKEDIDGICELGNDAIIGEDPLKYLGFDDEIINFELYANRGDLMSILGIAYEIGAIYNKKVKLPELEYTEIKNNINNEFNLKINTENCSLFLAKKAINITIKESPNFIKERLISSNIRPINNVVDISNYVMLETGQPLHFYDSDKLGNTIEVRMANDDETIVTLDNQKRSLSKEDIVITNSKEVIGLAGVMGGLSTEIDNNTKNTIIEAAIFNPAKIRRTSKKIMRSEASSRFERGLDPNRTYMAIERTCNLLQKYADAQIVSNICIYDKENKDVKKISISSKYINKVLGSNISKEEIINIFERLDFEVNSEEDYLHVVVPTRRLDINIPEDLIEEVGRIYGINKIKSSLPICTLKQGNYNKKMRNIRNKMASLGLNEIISYTLVNKDEVTSFTNDIFEPIKVQNPMTEDKSYLRYSLLPSLLRTFNYNISYSNKNINIFEIADSFCKTNERFLEQKKLAVLMSGDYYLDLFNSKKVDFFVIKGIMEELLDSLGYKNRYSLIPNNTPKELHPYQSANISVSGKNVGVIGKIHPNMDIDKNIYLMEINLSLLDEIKTGKIKFKDIPKYPFMNKDLAFIVNEKITSDEIKDIIKKSGGRLLSKIDVFDLYTEGLENQKSLAYSLTFQDENKTLTEEEVNTIFSKIIVDVSKKFNAILRDK